MNLKSKILAAGLAAVIAGGGIFATNMNTAQAQPAESADVAQLEAQVLQLQQQIAQISALIVQLKSQETCGNGICRFGETAAACPADCQNSNSTTCKTLWWSDNTSKICQQKQFCGTYMYLGLKTYETQAACQTALDAACSKECVAKGYALGGNYCVANEYGVLEACCCTGSASKCGNGTCDSGETATTCVKDCAEKTCYGEGEGGVGLTAGSAMPCCSGLSAQPRTTSYADGTQATTEGFVCRKPVATSCKKEGELFGYLESECCDGLLKVYPAGTKVYSAGESQNFQVTCRKKAFDCKTDSNCQSGVCSYGTCCAAGQCGWGDDGAGGPRMCIDSDSQKENQWLKGVCRKGVWKTALGGYGCNSFACDSGVCTNNACLTANGAACKDNSECASGSCSYGTCCAAGQCGWGDGAAGASNPRMCVDNGGKKENQWLKGVCRNGVWKTVYGGYGCNSFACDSGVCTSNKNTCI
jgi:hypothetical protein